MRLHVGPIPESPDFIPDDSWKALREPSPWMFQLLALPIGLAVAALFVFLWLLLTPVGDLEPSASLGMFLLSFAGIVVVHELVHALIHPGNGRHHASILGLWPAKIVFYAHYDGPMPRNRFIAILLMPLLVISVLPLLVLAITQTDSGWLAFISSFNALLACGDILGTGMVWYQIPAQAIVRNQGWKTYWRTR
jgi:hypothetical protein